MEATRVWARGVLAAAGLDRVLLVIHAEDADVPGGVLVLAVEGTPNVEIGRIPMSDDPGKTEATLILQAAMRAYLPPYPCAVLPPGPVATVHRALSDAAMAHMSGADATAPLRMALTTLTAMLAERPLPTRRGA